MAPEEAKALVVSVLQAMLAAADGTAVPLTDDLDLRDAGLIDSLRFVQLLGVLEHRLGRPIDVSEMDPQHLTRLGALSRHIAAQC